MQGARLVEPFAARLEGATPQAVAAYLRDVAILAVLYYGAAKAGFELEFTGPVAGVVWLPVGVAISFLALRGPRYWPGAVIGDLIANNYGTLTIFGGAGQSVGNLVEVLLGAYLLRRVIRRGPPLESVRGVAATLLAIAAGTAASALIGPLSLFAAGALHMSHLSTVMRTWWLADASGALIVVPIALAWFVRPTLPRPRIHALDVLVTLVAVGLTAWLATRTDNNVTYLVFPVLIVAALRLGPRGATTAVVLVTAFAIRATTHNEGPFSYTSITHSVLTTQLFIAVSSVSALVLVALVSEREAAAERLHAARLEIVRARYLERHRLERDLHDGAQQRMIALLAQLVTARRLATTEPARRSIDRADAEVRKTMAELRQLAGETFPAALSEAGIGPAVEELAGDAAVKVELLALPAERYDVAVEAAAYDVVSEALSNACAHGHAALVRIAVAAADGALRVTVDDDGVGGADDTVGLGLIRLRERVESFGGSFDVDSRPGRGTHVSAVIPTE